MVSDRNFPHFWRAIGCAFNCLQPKIPVASSGSEGASRVLGEILTWLGVAVAALATYAMYRSAERSDLPADSKESVDD
jgi:hypothetical protein